MGSFFHHLTNLEPKFYFLIVFLVLWGAGILWAVLFVLSHLSKKIKARGVLAKMQFEPTRNNPLLLEKVKEAALNTVYRNLAGTVDEFPANDGIKTIIKKGRIRIEYNTRAPEQNLPRPIGLKERIQVVARSVTLKTIYYKKDEDREAFYAETVDSKTTRRFRNRKERTSISGWIVCLPADTRYSTTFTVHPRYRGATKVLMNLAFRIAHVSPVRPAGLLPEFSESFDVQISDFDGEVPSLDEESQTKILSFSDSFCEDTNLTLAPNGVWLSGSTWPGPENFTNLITLCFSLVR